jgi:hypothetical protein
MSAHRLQGLTVSALGDDMFEPANWRSFKGFVQRVRTRAEVVAVRAGLSRSTHGVRSSSMDGNGEGEVCMTDRGHPVFA